MKNYTSNDLNDNIFILNYNVESDIIGNKRIVIKFADKKELVVPYSLENERIILGKMRRQVQDSNKFYEFSSSVYNTSLFLSIGELGALGILGYLSYYPYMTIPGLLFIKNLIIGYNYGKRRKDVEKNELFLEYEHLFIKENLTDDIIKNVSKKARDIIREKDKITLNDLDSFSYKDIESIIDNIKLCNALGLYYKPKTLIKEK